MIYSRLVLRLSFLMLFCAQKHNDKLHIEEKISSMVCFLYQLQDDSGLLPNYGSNDGTNIFSFSPSPYLDFSASIQTLYYLIKQEYLYPPGIYDEELLWFFGSPKSIRNMADLPRHNFSADSGGYYSIRSKGSFGMIRCHTYKTRPSHADMLHLDLWISGENVAVDSGTYQYYDTQGWSNYFKSTFAHNTVVVNDSSQMIEMGRFLWKEWTQSSLLWFHTEQDGYFTVWQGEHYGYKKRFGVIHRRSLYVCNGEWLIIDDIFKKIGNNITNDYSLLWHLALPEWNWQDNCLSYKKLGIIISFYGKFDDISLLSGKEHYPHTSVSSYYGDLEPHILIKCSRSSTESFRWFTAFGKQPVKKSEKHLHWCGKEFSLLPSLSGDE